MATILLVGNSVTDKTLFYKTHFLAGDPFIYLENGSRPKLITNSMERGRAEKESSVGQVKSFDDFGYLEALKSSGNQHQAFCDTLVRLWRAEGADELTVQATFPVLFADALRHAGATVMVDPLLFVEERRRKSEGEIQAIEEAQRATERAVEHAIDLVRAGDVRDGVLYLNGAALTSEFLRAEIEVALTRANMDVSSSPIVAGGPGAADPHWEGSGELRAGEAIVLDVFPRSKRTQYFSDMTRTIIKGQPPTDLANMYATVLQAQEAALAAIGPGANGRDAHEAVKRVFREAGYEGDGPGPRYIHGTGHGVGLDIHEGPGLSTLDEELREGDVVTVEPGLYDSKRGAIRIEDIVVVTRDGYRNLTNFPKQFVV